MMYRKRPLIRVWLYDNWEKWGQHFANGKTKFQWATFNKEKVNEKLAPLLAAMTQDHCAFCDGFPLNPLGATIEHFKPKSLFPLDSYKWENLFPCCGECQKKGENYDEKLLKPDEDGYDFNRYFVFNYYTGCIESNRLASLQDQERAEITVKMYRLNESGRPQARLRIFAQYNNSSHPEKDDFAYRFIL